MKKLLIIKTGSTLPEIKSQKGDFEDRILQGMNIDKKHARIVNVQNGEALPDSKTIDAVVISGSHDMVTDRRPWMETTAVWLKEAAMQNVPILGICFGHQLLAQALGGAVSDNRGGPAYGITKVNLGKSALNDPLCMSLPETFPAYASHSQSVLRIPEKARILAADSSGMPYIIHFEQRTWGVQFHPEFDEVIMQAYIADQIKNGIALSKGPKSRKSNSDDMSIAASVLKRFKSLCID